MSRMDDGAMPDAYDAIRMMRFMSESVMKDAKTLDGFVKTYKRMFPDWEAERVEEHYFFYNVSFTECAMNEYSDWLKTTADAWEKKIDEHARKED